MKGATRKLTRSGVPYQLWCFALEYELYVCSHTAHDIYKLDGWFPKTVVSGETADMSPFCDIKFLEIGQIPGQRGCFSWQLTDTWQVLWSQY
jgi:hypothetical protein